MVMGAVVSGGLQAVLAAHARPEALRWLTENLPAPGVTWSRGVLFGVFAGVQRRFGTDKPPLSDAETRTLAELDYARPEVCTSSDLARALLLRCALDASPEAEHVALVGEGLRKGETGERVAILRSLCLLPAPERFTELAVDMCRTHVLSVFEAIACDNWFPSRHFPQPSFNQLVIKALFVELPLERVVDFRKRANAELVRMASDYAAERRAAGRTVPADIALIQATETPR